MQLGALLVPHEPGSAAFVRRQLACDLAYYDLPAEAIADAVLVASELVGNAVRHTSASESGTLDVRWDVDTSGVRVSVGDPSDEPPRPRPVTEHETEGRGLQIVDAMSDDWGVRQEVHGKTVWAHVPALRLDTQTR
ncbi:MAG: ATP-binding protein [Jatrophihabitantaceae bacterium]